MIFYKKGNIADIKEGVIVHGVNCKGKMGSGVAKALAEAHPIVYREYIHACSRNLGSGLLGTYQPVRVTKELLVVNAFTQVYYGREKDVRYVSYDAVDTIFKDLAKIVKGTGLEIYTSKIGSGTGNGNWKVIEDIIIDRMGRFDDINLTVVSTD